MTVKIQSLTEKSEKKAQYGKKLNGKKVQTSMEVNPPAQIAKKMKTE